MFTDLGELLEHKRDYCKLRFTCKCHTFNGATPSTYMYRYIDIRTRRESAGKKLPVLSRYLISPSSRLTKPKVSLSLSFSLCSPLARCLNFPRISLRTSSVTYFCVKFDGRKRVIGPFSSWSFLRARRLLWMSWRFFSWIWGFSPNEKFYAPKNFLSLKYIIITIINFNFQNHKIYSFSSL